MSIDLVLLTPADEPLLTALLDVIEPFATVRLIRSLEELVHVAPSFAAETVLIAYGTGVIVPAAIVQNLARPGFNFHAAPPTYPGRDPHHFGAFDATRHWGATAHFLTERVDAGGIVGVDLVDLPAAIGPAALLACGNEALLRLFRRLAPALASGEVPPLLKDVHWSGFRRTRRDFYAACDLSPLISEAEFERRAAAFEVDGQANLCTTLHGHIFRIDKASPRGQHPAEQFTDFTEAAYEALLRLTLDLGYRFLLYSEAPAGRTVFWRHDIDVSVHRALRLAVIEHEKGVRATYFVDPHCQFYNMLEPGILAKLRAIRDLGHSLGLHFAANAYPAEGWTEAVLAERLAAEKALLERFLESPITTFSFHLPEFGDMRRFDGDEIAGMINAYGRHLRETCVYGSDSNGYWRHGPLADLIGGGKHERLQILTHPEWWTTDPMAPRARIERAVLGRARAAMCFYDDALARDGRLNISATGDRRAVDPTDTPVDVSPK